MQNLIRRGNTWFARFFIPKDRWADAGRATGAANGIKREVVRTLGVSDRREAKRRLSTALAAMQADTDASLRAAGLPPLTDWTADWPSRAVEIRATLQAADDTPSHNVTIAQTEDGETVEIGESERDHLRDAYRPEAEQLERIRGEATAAAFWKAATTDSLTLREALDTWLVEAAPTRRAKTVDGYRKVFSDLEQFLRQHHGHQSLASMTFPDVSRT